MYLKHGQHLMVLFWKVVEVLVCGTLLEEMGHLGMGHEVYSVAPLPVHSAS